jgi:serine/threonine protein kinase
MCMAEWRVPGYTGLGELGSGSTGTVLLASHDASGLLVAIKYLHSGLLADHEFTRLFRSEALTLSALDDRNIVRLYEYVESPSGAAIVMELVDGVTLRAILTSQGAIGAEAALVVLQGSLLGLAAAHWHGVVHRDYKPENVLINGEGNSKLTDFGVAARAGDQSIPAGSKPYAAPEQITAAQASPEADVYAATVTFYECLTGHLPFNGDVEGRLRGEPVPLEPVPGPLRMLVNAGMAKDPGRRPGDALEFVTRLRAAAASACGPDWEERGQADLGAAAMRLAALWPSSSPPTPPGTPVERIPLVRDLRRIGVLRAAVAIGVAVLVVAIGIALASTGSRQPTAAATPPVATVPPVTLGSASPSPAPRSRPSSSPSRARTSAPPSASASTPSPVPASVTTPAVSPSSAPASAPASPSAKPTSSPSPSPPPSASGCQPGGTGCVSPGSYPGPDLVINAAYGGSYKVVWTESIVAAGSPSWTADITYTNVTGSALVLNCQGAWTAASYVSEILSGGGGTFAAASTTCSQDPSLTEQLPPDGSYTLAATFDKVPAPGSNVAISWGNAGTTTDVNPFS